MSDRLDDIEEQFARLDDFEARLTRLEAHGLPDRVASLEAGFKRVERQLDLIFAQAQSTTRALGEQRILLIEQKAVIDSQGSVMERVASLLQQFVHQQTPSVEVASG